MRWLRFFIMAGLSVGLAKQALALEWLLPDADPFRTEAKTQKMVDPKLKPNYCPAIDPLQILNLRDVVVASLCNNPSTKAAYISLMGSAASFGGNYSGYFPSVSGTLGRNFSGSFTNDSKSSGRADSSGLTLGMTLYDFGQREFRLEAAERSLVAAGYSFNSTLQGTIASALQGYYSLLTAQNAVEVAKEAEGFAKASYDAAMVRYEIGQVALADKLQAKGSYSQAKLSVESAYNQLAQSQASLAQLMGLSADVPVQVSDVDDASLGQDPFPDQIQSLMAKAKEQRNDLQASRESLTASEIGLRATKRGNLGTVSATTSMGLSNSDLHLFNRDKSRSQAIGLSVSIPIFSGFSTTYSTRAAEKSLEAQREGLIASELGVERDVWAAWHNYETAKQSWKTSEDLIASATQLKDVTLGRYKEGLGTILDVLSAQSQYTSALNSQLQTRCSLLTSRVDLVRAVGELNLDTMQPTSVSANTTNGEVPIPPYLPPDPVLPPKPLQPREQP